MKKAIVLYMPVIHQGYLALIERHYPADIVLLTAENCKVISPIIADQLSRDIRCIPVEDVATLLHLKYPALRITLFDGIEYLQQFTKLIMPDEDISHKLIPLFSEKNVVLDTWFLRWDWGNTNTPKEVLADHTISTDELHRRWIMFAETEAQKSSDFWRQVGALVPFDDRILVAFNEHMPSSMEPYIHGDMRLIMRPGEQPEICGALHAEKTIFAQAVRLGISLAGKDMYVTTFPCLPCAQMISRCGIKRLFFKEGYSNQDAAGVLRASGIEIIQVK